MADPQVINTLSQKRKEIEAHIGSLERDLEDARRDLSAILAVIKVFSADGHRVTAYMNLTRLFPRHELPKLCQQALETHPNGMNTREMALFVIQAKELDHTDRHLRQSVAYKIVQIMRRWEKQGRARRLGKVSGAIVWSSLGLTAN